MKVAYMLVVLFNQTGTTQEYPFATLAQCEQVKPAVIELYNGLHQPVTLTCTPRMAPGSEVESVEKHSYKYKTVIKTKYKF